MLRSCPAILLGISSLFGAGSVIGCTPSAPPNGGGAGDVQAEYFLHASEADAQISSDHVPQVVEREGGIVTLVPRDPQSGVWETGEIITAEYVDGSIDYELVLYSIPLDNGEVAAVTREVSVLAAIDAAEISISQKINLAAAGASSAKIGPAKLIEIVDAVYDDQVDLLNLSGRTIYTDPTDVFTLRIEEGYVHFFPDLEIELTVDSPGQDIIDFITGILDEIRSAVAGIADELARNGDVDGAVDSFDELIEMSRALDGAAELSRPLAALADALTDPSRIKLAKARVAGTLAGKFTLQATATGEWSTGATVDLSDVLVGVLPVRVPVAGPLPIFLTLNIVFDLNMGLDGQIDVTTGFDFETSIDATFVLQDGNLSMPSPVGFGAPQFQEHEPTIDARLGFFARAGVTPQVGISLAEILTGTIDPELYLEFDATARGTLSPDEQCVTLDWELFAGLDAGVTARVELLGLEQGFPVYSSAPFTLASDTWKSPSCGNQAPEASNRTITVAYNTPTDIELIASDPDNGPAPLTFAIVNEPAYGTLIGTGGTRVYTPDTDYSGPDSFTFIASDGKDDSNLATVSITVRPDGPINEAPTASDQSVSIMFDTPTTIELAASDPDNGPSPLVHTIEEQPDHGIITGTGTTLTYTPASGYTGSDRFSYFVSDGVDDSNTATVSIDVLPPGALGSPTLVNPIASTTVEMVPVFDWHPVPGAVEYQIDLSANTLFSPVLWSTKSEPTAIGYTPPLADGIYYWRALGIDIKGNKGPYSSTGTFNKSWTMVPTLRRPTDGANISTGLVFEWSPVSGAERYQVVLSTSQGFNAVFEDFESHVTHVGWTPNLPDATYYWHVRSIDAEDNRGQWSTTRSFTIAWTAVPTLISPIGGDGSSSSPVFKWSALAGVEQYEIHLSSNIEFTTIFWDTKSYINHVAYTPALSDGNPYYWRVRCLDTDNKPGPWSSMASFVTTGKPVGGSAPPEPTSPIDGASLSEMPRLSWTAVASAEYYRVEISDDQLFTSTADSRYTANTVYVPNDGLGSGYPGGTSTPRNLRNLDPGTYYWRVRAFDEGDDEIGDWSVIRSFHVSLGAPVTLIAPSDGASVAGMPMLEWSATPAAAYYRVEVADDQLFAGTVDSRYTANTVYVPNDGLGAGYPGGTSTPRNLRNLDPGTYYWRVRAFTGDDVELWEYSEIRTFEIVAETGTNLMFPEDGANLGEMPMLAWSAIPAAAYYRVEISDDQLFTGTVDSRYTANVVYVPNDGLGAGYPGGTSSPRNLRNLQPGAYFWRVRAFTGDDAELWNASEIRRFFIGSR